MLDLDVTIVGGGIVGCAVAAQCARRGLRAALVEREGAVGRVTTSRCSEVAHGGMHYREGSAKARLCAPGRRLLRAFCRDVGVGYRECGKLIVAVDDDEVPRLEDLRRRGAANGVEDLALLDGAQVAALEPQVRAVAALHSPRTAILDAEGATRALAAAAREGGVEILTGSEVTALAPARGAWRVDARPAAGSDRAGWTHTSRHVVNAAGLHADRVAALAGVDVAARGWTLAWVKGSYFAVSPRHAGRVSRLVYPLPPVDGASLGIHLCVDLAGQLRLGPDVQPLASREREDYTVDPARRGLFHAEAARFLPFLAPDDLSPSLSGLRPRLASGAGDFVVQRETGDLAGLVNLVGIESPGLTAALALAAQVGEWVSA